MSLFVQEAAQRDILDQVEWYSGKGLFDIARRFSAASVEAIDALTRMPQAGAPKTSTNPKLAGLRTWPVKGFDEFRIYYLEGVEVLIVVRVLHSKRNTDAILNAQDVDEPGAVHRLD